jgi:multidrug efflux pump
VRRLFREFAVTLAVSIIVSAVVSLTLTPMMRARILRHEPKEQQGRIYRATERAFDGMVAFYGRTLKVVLRFQTVTLFVAVATLMLTIYLYIIIPKGFFAIQDTGVIQGITQAPPAISSQAMAREQSAITRVVPADPAGSRARSSKSTRKWIMVWRKSSVGACPSPWRTAISWGFKIVDDHQRMVHRNI